METWRRWRSPVPSQSGSPSLFPVVWFNTHGELAHVLQSETRGGTVSRAAQRMRHGFIVAQIALGFVLLAGTGLLALSLRHALATPPGFRAEHVLTGQISLPWKNYPKDDKRLAFIERLLGELRTLPGVTRVGIDSCLPFSGSNNDNATAVEGVRAEAGRLHSRALHFRRRRAITGRPSASPLLEGRLLEDADNHRKPHVCVVDEAFAKRYWPNGSALGHRIVNGAVFTRGLAHTIVGVVGTVKQNDLTESEGPGASIYYPTSPTPQPVFRSSCARPWRPRPWLQTLKRTVLAIDPELPVDDLKPMQARVEDSLVARRSPALLSPGYSPGLRSC